MSNKQDDILAVVKVANSLGIEISVWAVDVKTMSDAIAKGKVPKTELAKISNALDTYLMVLKNIKAEWGEVCP